MSADESKPLLDFLRGHLTRPQFVYRHQWLQHDLVLWDNRCTSHIAVYDFDGKQVRYMEKTSIRGTPSGYWYEDALQ
jgi:taurine dioxygenase